MPRWSAALPLAWLVVAGGCTRMSRNASLLPATPAADHVALELFFVRLPADDLTTSEALWASVDEQTIDVDVRRNLAANGIAVGRVGGQLPSAVTDLLQLSEDAATPSVDQPATLVPTKGPFLHRKLIDVYQIETPNRIVVTGERERHAKMVVLLRDEDEGVVHGRTLENAQGSLLTKVFPQPDGLVKLEIVPEIEYGQPQREITPDEAGAWSWQYTPPHETYDALRLSAVLSPGEALVFSYRGERPGSLGEQFFTDRQADVLHRLIVLIRVIKAQSDDLFRNEPRPDGSPT